VICRAISGFLRSQNDMNRAAWLIDQQRAAQAIPSIPRRGFDRISSWTRDVRWILSSDLFEQNEHGH
jgi:hypothetical protein